MSDKRRKLVQSRERLKGTLGRLKSFADGITNDTPISEIKTRLKRLDEGWVEFQTIEDSLLLYDDEESAMSIYEEIYFHTRTIFTTKIEAQAQPNPEASFPDQLNSTMTQFFNRQNALVQSLERSQQSLSLSNASRLPKLNIPAFSGEYKDWPAFKDLYEASPAVKSLRHLSDTFDEVIRGLKALGSQAESRDPWLIYIALTKVDAETREKWSEHTTETESPTFQNFLDFMANRCDALESCAILSKRPQSVKSLHASSLETVPCPHCSADHPLFKCPTFKEIPVEQRRKFVNLKALCFKCLGTDHAVRNCRSRVRCNACKANHHPLLHVPVNRKDTQIKPNFNARDSTYPPSNCITADIARSSGTFNQHIPLTATDPSPTQSSFNESPSSINPNTWSQQPARLSTFNTYIQQGSSSSHYSGNHNTDLPPQSMSLLPTALVKVMDAQGHFQHCRVLLDSGSQISLISESCIQRLALKRDKAKLSITGLQSSGVGTTRGKVVLSIHCRWNTNIQIQVSAFILPRLTSNIPSEHIAIPTGANIDTIQLADPYFYKPSSIDIIIGCDHFFDVLRDGKMFDSSNHHIARETLFGWVLFGSISTKLPTLTACSLVADLDHTLKQFWETENVTSKDDCLSKEEKLCESHFRANVSRDEHGRYMVALPFKSNGSVLGESKRNALRRLLTMERKFQKDPALKSQYVDFMQQYEKLGHMELIPKEQEARAFSQTFYLPHHGIFKAQPTSKIRVVFDGSCKSSTKVSLNDLLMVGPVIQRDLLSILMNFRKYKIAFSADLEKMYRQVLVSPSDREFQRILWREHSSEPIREYRLKTVTYGTASASFLATRVLHQIGEDYKARSPKAALIIQNHFYVDDLLSGCDSLSEAMELKSELLSIFKSCGFNLTKWKSNSSQLLQHDISSDVVSIDDSPEVSKILGIRWDARKDVFSFKVNLSASDQWTKRAILSESSRVFDPLGWLAPVTVQIKILFQGLWLLKYQWDDILPESISNRWEHIRTELPTLSKICIPRQIFPFNQEVQLHGFADASEAAYAAVIYCRCRDPNNIPVIRIVAAKTKVSPLRQVSLPRLELCGALLLSRLISVVKESLFLAEIPVYAWTDSMVVLSWLSDVPRRWKPYIANRTAEILETLPTNTWRHVGSKDNPADLATRGVSPNKLPECSLWWDGPKWLAYDPDQWPKQSTLINCHEAESERRKKDIICVHQTKDALFTEFSSHHSSFSRLIRILAFCLRFTFNCRTQRNKRRAQYLSAQELSHATTVCMRCIQSKYFSSEISALASKKPIPIRSSILKLTPFLDEDGLLKVGGRLQNSSSRFSAKHPIILPKADHVTEILVREAHKTYLHPGATLLIAILRQQYWILGIRDLVRKICRSCIKCFRQRAVRSTQLMGNLPEARVTPSRAFLKVGIDYAGPVSLCSRTGRGAKHSKGYIALFVCMSTKAIHLELVSSLTAQAFLAALQRFVSRRGIPAEIFSDNATNFVGGKRLLSEMHALALSNSNSEIIANFLSKFRISWHFIPPGAPNFGGIWEAAVRSVKWHLRRVLGETALTFEEMTTLLYQIEALLNSRPYSPMSGDPDDFEALTPSHFLVGEPLTALPGPDLSEVNQSRLGRWQHLQAMVRGFWKRWRLEHLTSLQERPKWRQEMDCLKKGELVIVGLSSVSTGDKAAQPTLPALALKPPRSRLSRSYLTTSYFLIAPPALALSRPVNPWLPLASKLGWAALTALDPVYPDRIPLTIYHYVVSPALALSRPVHLRLVLQLKPSSLPSRLWR